MITLEKLIELLNKKNKQPINTVDYKFNLGILLSSSYVEKNYNEKTKKKVISIKKDTIKDNLKEDIKDLCSGLSEAFSLSLCAGIAFFIYLFILDFFNSGTLFNEVNYSYLITCIFLVLSFSWFLYKISQKRDLEIHNREKENRSMFINKYLSDKESEKKLVEESLSLINDLDNIKSNYNKEVVEELRIYLIEETYKLQSGNDSELFKNVREDIAHQFLVSDINSKMIEKNKKIESKKIIKNENKNLTLDVENKFNLILKNNNKDIWDF